METIEIFGIPEERLLGILNTVHCKMDKLRHQSAVLPETALGLTL